MSSKVIPVMTLVCTLLLLPFSTALSAAQINLHCYTSDNDGNGQLDQIKCTSNATLFVDTPSNQNLWAVVGWLIDTVQFNLNPFVEAIIYIAPSSSTTNTAYFDTAATPNITIPAGTFCIAAGVCADQSKLVAIDKARPMLVGAEVVVADDGSFIGKFLFSEPVRWLNGVGTFPVNSTTQFKNAFTIESSNPNLLGAYCATGGPCNVYFLSGGRSNVATIYLSTNFTLEDCLIETVTPASNNSITDMVGNSLVVVGGELLWGGLRSSTYRNTGDPCWSNFSDPNYRSPEAYGEMVNSLLYVITQDLDGNGLIDAVRVGYPFPIQDHTVWANCTLIDYDLDGSQYRSYAATAILTGYQANDHEFLVLFPENSDLAGIGDTDLMANVYINANGCSVSVLTWYGYPANNINYYPSDGAPPIIFSASAYDFTVYITTSEDLSSVYPSGGEFLYNNFDQNSPIKHYLSMSPGNRTVAVSVDQYVVKSDFGNDSIVATPSFVDYSNNFVPSGYATPVVISQSDTNPPSVTGSSYQVGMNANNDALVISQITLGFNEDIYPASVVATDFTVSGGVVLSATSIAGSVTLSVNIPQLATVTPMVNFTRGNLSDPSGNLVQSFSITLPDVTPPTILHALFVEDSEGDFVSVNVTFSEPVYFSTPDCNSSFVIGPEMFSSGEIYGTSINGHVYGSTAVLVLVSPTNYTTTFGSMTFSGSCVSDVTGLVLPNPSSVIVTPPPRLLFAVGANGSNVIDVWFNMAFDSIDATKFLLQSTTTTASVSTAALSRSKYEIEITLTKALTHPTDFTTGIINLLPGATTLNGISNGLISTPFNNTGYIQHARSTQDWDGTNVQIVVNFTVPIDSDRFLYQGFIYINSFQQIGSTVITNTSASVTPAANLMPPQPAFTLTAQPGYAFTKDGQPLVGIPDASPLSVQDGTPPVLLTATASIGLSTVAISFSEAVNLSNVVIQCHSQSQAPSTAPSAAPTGVPTASPSAAPSVAPTASPTGQVGAPTTLPTLAPTTMVPTSMVPTIAPTTLVPTLSPTMAVTYYTVNYTTVDSSNYLLHLSAVLNVHDFDAGVVCTATASDAARNLGISSKTISRIAQWISAKVIDTNGDTFPDAIIAVATDEISSLNMDYITVYDLQGFFALGPPDYGNETVRFTFSPPPTRRVSDPLTIRVTDPTAISVTPPAFSTAPFIVYDAIVYPTAAPTRAPTTLAPSVSPTTLAPTTLAPTALVPSPSSTSPAPTSSPQPYPATVTCTPIIGADGIFAKVNVSCTPPISVPLYPQLTLYNGYVYGYSEALPLILPCGPRTVTLSTVPYPAAASLPASTKYTINLNISCPNASVIDTQFAVQAFQVISNYINLSLSLREDSQNHSVFSAKVLPKSIALVEALALVPPLVLTTRRSVRDQVVAYAARFPPTTDNPDSVVIVDNMVKPNEVNMTSMLAYLKNLPPSAATIATTLTVISTYASTYTDSSSTDSSLVNSNPGQTPKQVQIAEANALLAALEEVPTKMRDLLSDDTPSLSFNWGPNACVGVRTNASSFLAGVDASITTTISMNVGFPRDFAALMKGSSFIDCVLMAVPAAIIAALTFTGRSCETSQNVLSLNCYLPGDPAPLPINGLNTTDPLRLTIPHRVSGPGEYAECSFWRNSTPILSQTGCTSDNSLSNATVCLCTHATVFAVTFIPTANPITDRDFTELNGNNIAKNPVPISTVFLLSGVFLILFIFAVLRDRREKDDKLRDEKLKKYAEGQAVYPKFTNDFWNELRHEHLWVSVVYRQFGDPYTSVHRLLCLAATVYTTFFMNGLWYSTPAKSANFGSSVAASLCGLAISLPLGQGYERGARLGLQAAADSVHRASLAANRQDPKRVLSRRILLACSIISLAIVAVCALLIIVLGLSFDLGDPSCLPAGSCFCTIALVRQKASWSWLSRCIVSLVLDIFIFRPLIVLGLVLLRRRTFFLCCNNKSRADNIQLMSLPADAKKVDEEEAEKPRAKDNANEDEQNKKNE